MSVYYKRIILPVTKLNGKNKLPQKPPLTRQLKFERLYYKIFDRIFMDHRHWPQEKVYAKTDAWIKRNWKT